MEIPDKLPTAKVWDKVENGPAPYASVYFATEFVLNPWPRQCPYCLQKDPQGKHSTSCGEIPYYIHLGYAMPAPCEGPSPRQWHYMCIDCDFRINLPEGAVGQRFKELSEPEEGNPFPC